MNINCRYLHTEHNPWDNEHWYHKHIIYSYSLAGLLGCDFYIQSTEITQYYYHHLNFRYAHIIYYIK